MKYILFCLAILATSAIVKDTPTAPPETYGSAEVSRVCQVALDGALICDLEGLPALIGKQIPVYLKDAEITADSEISQNVIAFIRQTVKPDAKGNTPKIQLSDIRRGRTFSLVAKIAIDGKDLTEMLIEKGLAQQIIILDPVQETPNNAPTAGAPTDGGIKSKPVPATGFAASKSSKVYHRTDCSHAKRMDMSKASTFRTRQDAEQNGRRPCKTCNP